MSRKIGVLFSYVLMIIEMLSSLLFTPFLIRSFGQAEFGVYSLVLSLTTYLTLLDLGVGNALIRYITKFRVTNDEESSKKLKGTLIVFYLVMGILCVVIGLVLVALFKHLFANGLTSEEIQIGKSLMLITIANIAVTLMFTPYNKILLAYEHFGLVKILEIFRIVVRVSISIVVLLLGGKSVEISLVNLSINVILQLITMAVSNKMIPIKPIFFSKDYAFLKEVITYTSFLFLQMVAAQINNMTDHILLGIFATSTIIAIYQVGTQIIQYFQTFASSFNGVLQPGVVRLVETNPGNNKVLEDEMIRIGRLIFCVLSLIYVVFLINGQAFIELWVGTGYKKSYYVTLIILTPLVMILSQNIGTQVLYALDKHKIQAVLKILVAVLNILLTMILILKMDPVIGAAIGTAFAAFMGDFIVMNMIFRKELGIHPLSFNYRIVKRTIVCLFFTAIAGLGINLITIPSVLLQFVLSCFVMVVVYSIAMWKYGFNNYERQMIHQIHFKCIQKKIYKKG